jgi:gamma-glutamylcyclotransferase
MLLIRLLLKLRGIFARSWWLSWCLYRLHRLPLVGPPEEEVWYFAYGANMHDSVFRGWRGMRPLDWRPGRVRGAPDFWWATR